MIDSYVQLAQVCVCMHAVLVLVLVLVVRSVVGVLPYCVFDSRLSRVVRFMRCASTNLIRSIHAIGRDETCVFV